MKIATYKCPKKGCDFQYLPGTGLGGKPVMLITQSEKKVHHIPRLVTSGGPACPKHFVRLVKQVEKIKLPKREMKYE
jgi:hypothetical protein